VVLIGNGTGELKGADDARRAAVFSRDNLPDSIVFDHRRIIDDYFRYEATGERPRVTHS